MSRAAIEALLRATRQRCGICGAVHQATRCHICKTLPPVPEHERAAMLDVYCERPGLHHLSFEQCLADFGIRLCLRNTALSRRAARAARMAQDPATFELVS